MHRRSRGAVSRALRVMYEPTHVPKETKRLNRKYWGSYPLAVAIVTGTLLMVVPFTVGQENAKNSPQSGAPAAAPAKESAEAQMPYLGVAVEPLHPAFWTHLKDVLEQKEGILVDEVAPGSPADKAGVKPHDILRTYGEQRLYSPDQLAGLIHADKAGNQVRLGILREGKPQEITVMLGEQTVQTAQRRDLKPMRHGSQMHSRRREVAENEKGWESLDSLSLKNLGNHRFQVEIRYLDKKGKMEHRSFEGTREEIRKDIQAQKDLPANERAHLLGSLSLPDDELPVGFPTAFYTPGGHMILESPGFDAATPPQDV